MIDIRKTFKAHCGLGARFIKGSLQQRGEYNTVMIYFKMIPEDRTFQMDGVLHEGDTRDEQLENAIVKIASKVKNIRAILAAPDGRGEVYIERQLS